jgi:hypothetical protein
MAALTTKKIESIKPREVRQEIADGGCRGLYLIVQPSGRRSWAVRYRFKGASKKLTLEGAVTLAEARKAATGALHELDRGNDPAGLKFDARAAEEKAAAIRAGDTVENLAARFIERYAKKETRENSWRMTQRPDHSRHQAPRRHRACRGRRRRHSRPCQQGACGAVKILQLACLP